MSDIMRGAASAMRASGAHDELRCLLRQASGLPNVWSLSSGRAAMTTILRAMRECSGDEDRDQVIMPAYTCYSVPAAVQRAGLKPRLCDVDPQTLGIDPEALSRFDFSRVLAVTSANLYGLPNDLAALESICRSRDVFLLDDAAQALGASLDGREVGSFGDAGLYSFDKGKIISTMQGGAIVCRQNGLASRLESILRRLPASTIADGLGNLVKLIAYSIFLRPGPYDVVRRLPYTGIGQTVYELRYPITQLSTLQVAVAAKLMARLASLNAHRRRRAEDLHRAVCDLRGLQQIRLMPRARAVFARYPLRVRDASTRAQVILSMNRAGIGATASYPLSLVDVPEVLHAVPPIDRACPGAREIAATIVTLPTHAYCPPNLGHRVREILSACLT